MTGHRTRATIAAMLMAAGACSSATSAATPPSSGATAPSVRATEPAAPPFPVNFLREIFAADSATITNEWWPLTPGTQWIWEGTALDGEDEIRRRIVFTVTDLTKEIAGVRTLVGWDRDYNNDVLSESELIFLAQDTSGNVWHFGQYVEKYDEEGALDGATAWLVGYLADAKAGIMMKANPQVGDPPYSEGYAPPPFFWDDFGEPIRSGQKACVRIGCFDDVLVIEETEPTKPDASQLKWYARGIGNIKIGWSGEEEAEQEEMELVRTFTLSPAGMREVRAAAAKLESRAIVYGQTSPLQTPAATPAATPGAASPTPST